MPRAMETEMRRLFNELERARTARQQQCVVGARRCVAGLAQILRNRSRRQGSRRGPRHERTRLHTCWPATVERIEALARELGLDFYPVVSSSCPNNFMNEVAIYGLPIRMPHWSFGVRYIHQLIRQSMGHSRIFEVMFPGNPCHGYLVEHQHARREHAGHRARARPRGFRQEQPPLRALRRDVGHQHRRARRGAGAPHRRGGARTTGRQRVEAMLDAALALEPHVDLDQELHRPLYPDAQPAPARRKSGPIRSATASGICPAKPTRARKTPRERKPRRSRRIRSPICCGSSRTTRPELEDWERDIFLAVRDESFYFYPVFACNIMNEGWATYWHARLLREADFLPHELYLDAVNVPLERGAAVRRRQQVALAINPYHVGFSMWERIVEKHGLENAREIWRDEDDFGFIRNFLDAELADKLGLFVYEGARTATSRSPARDIGRCAKRYSRRSSTTARRVWRCTRSAPDGSLESAPRLPARRPRPRSAAGRTSHGIRGPGCGGGRSRCTRSIFAA